MNIMDKRTFLRYSSLAVGGLFFHPVLGWSKEKAQPSLTSDPAFSLPDLPYDHKALEPHIDEETMRIHHGKHHAAYVNNLNKAIEGSRFVGYSIREIMPMIAATDTAVRNNGGGHYNHNLFWKILTPTSATQPNEALAQAIQATFGSMEELKKQWLAAATSRFGSGWAWLAVDKTGKLFISSTPNQDNPLMYQVVDQPGYPIAGIDVWEHAYYLKYQNKRADYLQAVWNLLNWEEISKQFRTGKHPFIVWSQMDELHHVMSATFHPMEKGNLVPIKSRSAELAAKAKLVATSSFPARFDSPSIRSTAKKLAKDSKALDKMIQKGANDAAITSRLTALHDTFHEIVGLCMDDM